MGEASDAELLHAVGRGDRAAFEEFYARTAPWLAVRLRRRCRDDDLVAEVLQDAFVAVWRSAGSYHATGDPAGWVWTTASRKLIDAYRRRAARDTVAESFPEDAARLPSAEDEALTWDADVFTAVARLSPELQAVLRATVLDGWSTREASLLLGVPEGTVKTRARRARLLLREALS